jgi:hypothetical protein
MSAEFELEESGDTGAWVMKSRSIGGEWSTCESAVDDREMFFAECLGPAGDAPVGDDDDEDADE